MTNRTDFDLYMWIQAMCVYIEYKLCVYIYRGWFLCVLLQWDLCLYTYICICTYVCIYIIYIYKYQQILHRTSIYVNTHIRCVYTYTHTYVCKYKHTCVDMISLTTNQHIYIYIWIHKYTSDICERAYPYTNIYDTCACVFMLELFKYMYVYKYICNIPTRTNKHRISDTGWRRPIECLHLQVISRKH